MTGSDDYRCLDFCLNRWNTKYRRGVETIPTRVCSTSKQHLTDHMKQFGIARNVTTVSAGTLSDICRTSRTSTEGLQDLCTGCSTTEEKRADVPRPYQARHAWKVPDLMSIRTKCKFSRSFCFALRGLSYAVEYVDTYHRVSHDHQLDSQGNGSRLPAPEITPDRSELQPSAATTRSRSSEPQTVHLSRRQMSMSVVPSAACRLVA